MNRKSELAKRLEAAGADLREAEPGFWVPDFQTDEEELEWLEANYERLAHLTLKHGVKVKLVLKEPTKQISIRVPERDLERAKEIAGREKVNYQSVVKRALRRGLAGEGREREEGSPAGAAGLEVGKAAGGHERLLEALREEKERVEEAIAKLSSAAAVGRRGRSRPGAPSGRTLRAAKKRK
jgi:predicted DNA binding CopG/RHH family protein